MTETRTRFELMPEQSSGSLASRLGDGRGIRVEIRDQTNIPESWDPPFVVEVNGKRVGIHFNDVIEVDLEAVKQAGGDLFIKQLAGIAHQK